MNTQSKQDYNFTTYSHAEIIEAIEAYRKRNNITKSRLATKIGYNDTMYFGLFSGNARFSQHSFNRFAQKYAPQLIGNTLKIEPVKIETSVKEQECIEYLKAKGYKIMKPVTEFVEL